MTHSVADNGYSVNHFDLCNDMQAAVYLNYSYCVGVEVSSAATLCISYNVNKVSKLLGKIIIDKLMHGIPFSFNKDGSINEICMIFTK